MLTKLIQEVVPAFTQTDSSQSMNTKDILKMKCNSASLNTLSSNKSRTVT